MEQLCSVPRILISATGSGCGKTTVTAAILGALCKRGLQVQSFKCGPDYLDPMFHQYITGRPAYHADPFFLEPQPMRRLVSCVGASADVSVLEGAMGYYDGIGQTERASAYTVSQILEVPTLLVLSPKGMGCSEGHSARAFCSFAAPIPFGASF